MWEMKCKRWNGIINNSSLTPSQQLGQIFRYFPDLTNRQRQQLTSLAPLYQEWNKKINVVSRKDIDNIYLHHVLHSLAIAKIVSFLPGVRVLDVGTGGGFPGIPLAILFPETQFHLVDSIGKKIKVVQVVTDALELENVSSEHVRAENVRGQYDFVVTRAVAQLQILLRWCRRKVYNESKHPLSNGLLALKGGDLTNELEKAKAKHALYSLDRYFQEPSFQGKYVVYVPL